MCIKYMERPSCYFDVLAVFPFSMFLTGVISDNLINAGVGRVFGFLKVFKIRIAF